MKWDIRLDDQNMKKWRKKSGPDGLAAAAVFAAAFTAASWFLPGTVCAWAGQWDAVVQGKLGAERKQQMEAQAQAADPGIVQIYWSAPVGEDGNIIPGPNDGIPEGALFYSSVDLVWQPLEKSVSHLNSVHQFAADTGTVYISWNNGRGRLFAYSAQQYEGLCQAVRQFREDCITEDMSDFEKEMQIVQYLVDRVSFPIERYMNGTDTKEDHSAYGALVKGEAVCEGYAEAFCWLAEACGLETKFLYGIYNGDSHDWNMVKLDGHWYHVDVTSEDPIPERGQSNGLGWGRLCNEYINLTDDQMLRDHRWQPFSDAACQMTVYGPEAVAAYLGKS